MGPGTSFHRLIHEIDPIASADKVRLVVLCSGKVYFDLLKARREKKLDDVAILRLEQLYPFPTASFAALMKPYENAELVWCQEEPENMGAWSFVDRRLERALATIDVKARRARYAGRPEAAATATTGFACCAAR